MKKQTTTTAEADRIVNSSTGSNIDLTTMRQRDLVALARAVESELAERSMPDIGDLDAVLQFKLRLVTKDGEVSANEGTIKFAKLLHPRLIAESPGRVEHEFMQQVYGPISADLYDVLDESSPIKGQSIEELNQHINDGGFSMPALPDASMH